MFVKIRDNCAINNFWVVKVEEEKEGIFVCSGRPGGSVGFNYEKSDYSLEQTIKMLNNENTI